MLRMPDGKWCGIGRSSSNNSRTGEQTESTNGKDWTDVPPDPDFQRIAEVKNTPCVSGDRRFFVGRFFTGSGGAAADNEVQEMSLWWTDDGNDFKRLPLHSGHADVGRAVMVQRSNGDLYITAYKASNYKTTTEIWEFVVRETSNPDPSVLKATLYKKSSYNTSGWAISLEPGEYTTADLIAFGAEDNDVSSLQVPAGLIVTLYDGDNFTGNSLIKTTDDASLDDDGFTDLTSSVIVAEAATMHRTAIISKQYVNKKNNTSLRLFIKDNRERLKHCYVFDGIRVFDVKGCKRLVWNK